MSARRRGVRALAVAALAAGAAAVLITLLSGGGYTIHAIFINGGQLVAGDQVEVAGTPVGSISSIGITDDGRADVTMTLDKAYAPLRAGTRAIVRQASLTGVANRYVDLRIPAWSPGAATIPNGGVLSQSQTTSIVDLDQVLDTFDASTRQALKGFLKGESTQFQDVTAQADAGLHYLDPAISTSSAVFKELNLDTPLLAAFVDNSDRFVTNVAARGDRLTQLIHNLDLTTQALGDQQVPLEQAIANLPGFMRQSNTTFVNLRATLDQADPLVNASKPVAQRLQTFLPELTAFTADAAPTLNQLDSILNRPGHNGDLVELLRSLTPVAHEALDTTNRDGTRRRGSFPENTQALTDSAPIVAFGRPYTPDLFGWFDDFSLTGAYDALGAFSRAHTFINAFDNVNGIPTFIPLAERAANLQSLLREGQYKRCPGAAESPAADGSNVPSAAEQKALDCTASAGAVAPQ